MRDMLARLRCCLGSHRWRDVAPNAVSTGIYQRCDRCHKERLEMLNGCTYYPRAREKWTHF